MTKRNIFSVVADVKKTLESDRHFIYRETFGKVYDVRNLEITGISIEGAIRVYDINSEDAFWFNFKQLMTKADAENEDRKVLSRYINKRLKAGES